jgi:hypothetical protein
MRFSLEAPKRNSVISFMSWCIIFVLLWACMVAFIPQHETSASEGKSLIVFGKDIVVRNSIDIIRAISIGGNVTVYGHVRKEVVSIGGSVFLGYESIVQGNVVSVGGTVERERTRFTGRWRGNNHRCNRADLLFVLVTKARYGKSP